MQPYLLIAVAGFSATHTWLFSSGSAAMPWQREAEFREVLDKAVKKGSKGAIATVQKIALEDMGQVGLTVTTVHADHAVLSIPQF